MKPGELKIGNTYYMLQGGSKGPPIVTSFEYRGPTDDKPHVHFFKALGLSDANIFLETAQLSAIVDLRGLKQSLERMDHAS